MNPGSHTPQACILNQARRRPHRIDAPQKPIQIKKPISLEILVAINKAVTEVKNNGIESYKQVEHHLKQISRNADIFNPESVKTYIKDMVKENGEPIQNSTRNKMITSYDYFCQNQNLCWEKPFYKVSFINKNCLFVISEPLSFCNVLQNLIDNASKLKAS